MNPKKCPHGFYLDPFGKHMPEKSTDELLEEVKKYFPQLQKKEPEEPKPRQQPKTNEIRKFSSIIENAFDY